MTKIINEAKEIMNMKDKKLHTNLNVFFLVVFFVLISLQNTVLAAETTATIEDLRVSVNDDKVRIVADADNEVDYQSFALSSPNRIVIDLTGAKLSKAVTREMDIDSEYVKKVRVGQFNKDVVRIVVESDLNKDDYDVFGIVGGSSAYRVAMDFGNISFGVNNTTTNNKVNNKTDKKDNVVNKVDKTDKQDTADKSNKKQNSVNNNGTEFKISDSDKLVLKNKRITLDPGHGGNDSGAIGPTGYYEKDATLDISLNVAEMLKRAGAKVYITRRDDRDVAPQPATDVEELQARVNVGNYSNSDIFVSVHIDSFTSASAGGTTGYYYVNGSDASRRLADYIKKGIVTNIGTFDRGTKTSNFYVVKNTAMPATLIEVAFISNPEEEAILKSDEGQKEIAQGIFSGIVKFFSE